MPPRIPKQSMPSSLQQPSVQTYCQRCLRRAFSSTPSTSTKLRREMFAWLNGPGENFRYPLPNSTNYLSAYDKRGNLLRAVDGTKAVSPSGPDTADTKALEEAATGPKLERETQEDLRPFPLNQHFVSQSILSEELRQEIWRRVKVHGKSVRMVSLELGVEMRRVAASVRLVEVELQMRAEETSCSSLCTCHSFHGAHHPFDPSTPDKIQQHESINDLPVHALTTPQIFYPTSESRPFNRVDAGRVFSGAPRLPSELDPSEGGTPSAPAWQNTKREIVGKRGHEMPVLKPADARIPHPQLIAYAKDLNDRTLEGGRAEALRRHQERLQEDVEKRREKVENIRKKQEARTKRVETERWEFIVKEVKATRLGTGLDGRGTDSPGYRYGVPAQDRKRAQVKIPTRVEV